MRASASPLFLSLSIPLSPCRRAGRGGDREAALRLFRLAWTAHILQDVREGKCEASVSWAGGQQGARRGSRILTLQHGDKPEAAGWACAWVYVNKNE